MRLAAGLPQPSAESPRTAAAAPTWAAHAASVWAFAFAAMSFYWAAGGTAGLGTVGHTVEGLLATGGWFTVVVWLAGAVKAAGGMLALALVRPWGTWFPRGVLLAAASASGVALTGYALLNLGARAVQALGLIPTPASMHSAAAWWHLLFWNPWFLAGGVLFLLGAWHYRIATTSGRPR